MRERVAPFDDATALRWLARLAALPPVAQPAAVTFPAHQADDGHADSAAADPDEPAAAATPGPGAGPARPDGAA